MKQKEVIITKKGGCLQSPSPKVRTQNLVLNPHGKCPSLFRIMDFTIFPKIWTKDKPETSFIVRNKIVHLFKTLGWLTAARELCRTIATKNPERRSLGKSLDTYRAILVVSRLLRLIAWTFYFSLAKVQQNQISCAIN